MNQSAASETIVSLAGGDSAMLDLPHKAGLPTSDLRKGSDRRFIGIREGSQLIATGGLEPHGSYGLLRALVVAESHRGSGRGTYISENLISEARALGLKEPHLLTTRAERFF